MKKIEDLLIKTDLYLRNKQAPGPTELINAAMAMVSPRHKLAIASSVWLLERQDSTSIASPSQGPDALLAYSCFLAMHGAPVHMYVCPT